MDLASDFLDSDRSHFMETGGLNSAIIVLGLAVVGLILAMGVVWWTGVRGE